MGINRVIDAVTLGADRPIRRLVAYYVLLIALTVVLVYFVPFADRMFAGERLQELTQAPQLLQDGMTGDQFSSPAAKLPQRLDLAITTSLMIVTTLALMLPVTWVYTSSRPSQRHDQSIAQTLLILPIVVAGIVMIVRNSLALAFSLAGIVAAVRFRTNLRDSRDGVFIFLAIAVGFASGVQVLTIGALISIVFNFVVLLVWRYDFGRNVLQPSVSSQSWTEPLSALVGRRGATPVADHDLVLALTPKEAKVLAERFNRVRSILGPKGKSPRYNALLTLATDSIREVQEKVEPVLEQVTKRWALDGVITNDGKPCLVSYLVYIRKSSSRDAVLTAVRTAAGDKIVNADLELNVAQEKRELDVA